MPKRVAIVDIGSNSARVVIYQRTSRFGFHLIAQQKAKVRISEGSFNNGGILQEKAINRAINALKLFKNIIDEYKARKTIIVATAAVRNAPNRYEFISKVKKETNLKIKVIDGKKEAFFGAVAAINLLPIQQNSISIDIGGGSSDIALIKEGKVISTISLPIGTITIKELFFDKNLPIDKAKEFINKELKKIPNDFKAECAIAIGGVLRAFAKSVIETNNYSYKKIHAFNYNIDENLDLIEAILNAKNSSDLEKLYIKENRYDTIKEGVLLFKEILNKLKINNVITSGVGIREGVFLNDMLRGVGGKFPKELNPSIVSIKDRLDILNLETKTKEKIAKMLYNILKDKIDNCYYNELINAIKLSNIGKSLTIYDEHKHTYYLASQELNWQLTHKQMLLIAAILRSKGDRLFYKSLKKEHKKLLPSKNILKWLGFIYTVSNLLYEHAPKSKFKFEYSNNILTIFSSCNLYLFEEDIKTLKLPKELEIKIIY
jgi:exopolyphosphatase/guanosine-5'-triphosphate,3'-diphosphate pyrophosphatase